MSRRHFSDILNEEVTLTKGEISRIRAKERRLAYDYGSTDTVLKLMEPYICKHCPNFTPLEDPKYKGSCSKNNGTIKYNGDFCSNNPKFVTAMASSDWYDEF